MEIFRGVIEDNKHPDKNGLVKVRVFGIHTPNNENSGEFESISTSELPWAEVMGSTENGLVTGIGLSNIPKQGQMVWVTFKNNDYNYPLIIGTITGKQSEKIDYSSGKGFNDPAGEYPFEDRLNEYDINRLCTGENLDKTIHKSINDSKMSISGHVSITQPVSTNDKTEYTYNSVLETKSGHVIELDDTEGNERVRIYHKSGTFDEIDLNGDKINRNTGNYYILTEKDLNVLVEGAVQQYIKGNKTEHVVGKVDEKYDGGLKTVGGPKIDLDAGIIYLN